MKKLFYLLLLCSIIGTYILPSNRTFAAENQSSLNEVYDNAYTYCLNNKYSEIKDDYSAYSFLLHNTQFVTIRRGKINAEKLTQTVMSSHDRENFTDFIGKLNALVEDGVINIDEKCRISENEFHSDIDHRKLERNIAVNSSVFDLLSLARSHADDLKRVYDNAVFSTKHVVAGEYFAERVKSGGVWDYKRFLGTKSRYYVPGLGTMTGEEIGNFHYGYVGSTCFSANT